MKSNTFLFALSVVTVFTLCNAAFVRHEDADLEGYWVRPLDHLQMQVITQDENVLYSFIISDGDEKVPGHVKELPIYKNISRVGYNLWVCDFLVVAVADKATYYEEGSIRVNKNGEMEINCPGFGRKVYSRIKLR